MMVVFGALLCVPGAAAQVVPPSVTVSTDFSGLENGRLRPETTAIVGSIWARIEVPAFVFCVADVPTMFRVREAPAYASVEFLEPLQYVEIGPGPSPRSYDVKTLVAVSVSRDAPAFENGLYSFVVEVRPPPLQAGCNLGPSAGRAEATIKNDYVPGIRLGETSSENDGASGWIDVPIENLANGPTRVRPVLEAADPDDFLLLHAGDVVLESRATSGPESSWSKVMRISYVLDGVETSAIKVRFVAGHDHFESEQETIDVVYEAVGTLGTAGESGEAQEFEPDHGQVPELPGPSIPMLMLIGAALLAMVRRRHQ